ncbi:bacterial bifunctional deaminase-reductase [Trematosphaeria pertusa]|uniref:2,5-diamino-6-ribosylamino-4(3H)-pyrimidinone 5'-phosphate reductase n=1 Tax=Trematosphaeria pertusa TaxID=390896 RepID=A0A6A6I084_9PLEO|nr:bacterial bifunctional deaminase-reductase [Trematosphaeria pertusa]KAF2243904.1 bacterial bifunctional deaminase-reductase [Trematosphaeria pertusa]
MSAPTRDALHFPPSSRQPIEPYLPSSNLSASQIRPFTTLTYATSLDHALSLSPGVQTALSGPESKAMTHYLRSKHDAILIGAGTAIADNPSLNCRIEGVGGYGGNGLEGQPRPVVIDPRGRWNVSEESKIVRLAAEGRGRGPWVIMREDVDSSIREAREKALNTVGGRVLTLPSTCSSLDWREILRLLAREGVRSVMIEGGGVVINDLLGPRYFSLIDSVIVTIAPTWLGKGSLQVCPDERVDEQGRKVAVGRLKDLRWVPLGEDVVLCGRPEIG